MKCSHCLGVFVFCITFALVLTAVSVFGQDTRAKLEGVVTEGSKPVVGVLALANDYESVWHMKTDAAGEFSFFVPSGCYDVLLSSPVFHPEVKRVCIQSGEVKKLSIKLKREAAPKLLMKSCNSGIVGEVSASRNVSGVAG